MSAWRRRQTTVEGELRLLEREVQKCDPQCTTLKADHLLRVSLRSPVPGDSRVARLLDGNVVVRALAHSLAGGSGAGRG